jgi:hypothetical protein
VRLVSLMIRKTLGWCDANGHPQHEQIALSYADFEAAGISRGMIKTAVGEAINRRFIRCVEQPRTKSRGQAASSARYELDWDERPEYIKDPKRFHGFFAGDGNRTYIPNQFFDHVVVREASAVVKVVGSVIRFSIGFVNKWGHRRLHVPLSYTDIQRYSKLRNRESLCEALHAALAANYLERVEAGYFDPKGGMQSRTAIYAVKWRSKATNDPIGMKNVPAKIQSENRFEIRTGIGMKNVPADRFEIRTSIQIKETNNNSKQQDAASFEKSADATIAAAVEALRAEGFDASTANRLAGKHPIERILRQLDWIDAREAKRNRLGMLRVAIEQDWTKPTDEKLRHRNRESRSE